VIKPDKGISFQSGCGSALLLFRPGFSSGGGIPSLHVGTYRHCMWGHTVTARGGHAVTACGAYRHCMSGHTVTACGGIPSLHVGTYRNCTSLDGVSYLLNSIRARARLYMYVCMYVCMSHYSSAQPQYSCTSHSPILTTVYSTAVQATRQYSQLSTVQLYKPLANTHNYLKYSCTSHSPILTTIYSTAV